MKRSCRQCRRTQEGFIGLGRLLDYEGVVYKFGPEDIVKGGGDISSQCCNSTEIELGTVYSISLVLIQNLTACT